MATMSSFTATFTRALEQAPKQLEDNYEGTHGRPVMFPEMSVAYPTPSQSTDSTEQVMVSLKSIRAPKFQLQYSVPRSDTIFAIKERLLSDPGMPLQNAKLSPASIKLLLKAKVIPDTRQLRELTSTEFTVMFVTASEAIEVPVPAQVYWGAQASIEPQAKMSATLTSGNASSKTAHTNKRGMNAAFWRDIEAVVRRYVDEAPMLVEQFKLAAANAEKLDLD